MDDHAKPPPFLPFFLLSFFQPSNQPTASQLTQNTDVHPILRYHPLIHRSITTLYTVSTTTTSPLLLLAWVHAAPVAIDGGAAGFTIVNTDSHFLQHNVSLQFTSNPAFLVFLAFAHDAPHDVRGMNVTMDNGSSGTLSLQLITTTDASDVRGANVGRGTRLEVWGMYDPPFGINDVVITLSMPANVVGRVAAFQNVNPTAPFISMDGSAASIAAANAAARAQMSHQYRGTGSMFIAFVATNALAATLNNPSPTQIEVYRTSAFNTVAFTADTDGSSTFVEYLFQPNDPIYSVYAITGVELNPVDPDCVSDPCLNGGTCVGDEAVPLSRFCICAPTFGGADCGQPDACDIATCNRTARQMGDGLVLAMGFEEEEGSAFALDNSNNHFHGGTGAARRVVNGRWGHAMRFNGEDAAIVVYGVDASVHFTLGFTVMAWVWPEPSNTGVVAILRLHDDALQLNLVDGILRIDGSFTSTSVGWTIPDAVWTHIAATFDGSIVALHVNGTLVDSFLTAGTGMSTSTGRLVIGGRYPGSGEYFHGVLDEVLLYGRALSEADINRDMGCSVVAVSPCATNETHVGTCSVVGMGVASCEYAPVLDPCSYSPCLNGGTCTLYPVSADESPEGFQCQCTAAFRGITCDIDVDPCDAHQCARRLTNSDGLVAAFGFEEGNGDEYVRDSSGNGIDGSLSDVVKRVPGFYGRGIEFDGVRSKVVLSESSALDMTTGITISLWAMRFAGGSFDAFVFKGNSYGLRRRGSRTRAIASILPESLQHTDYNFPVNQWTHVAMTYDLRIVRLFFNGSCVGSFPERNPLRVDSPRVYLGALADGSEAFKGVMDEVRLYNRSLTPVEIRRDMDCSVAVVQPCPPVGTDEPQCSPGTGPPTNFTCAYTTVDACSASPCQNGGTCSTDVNNGPQAYICSCATDFMGRQCEAVRRSCDMDACVRSSEAEGLLVAYGFEEPDGALYVEDSSNGTRSVRGTVGSAVRIDDGYFGRGLRFGAMGSTVRFFDNPADPYIIGSAITVEMWVKRDGGFGVPYEFGSLFVAVDSTQATPFQVTTVSKRFSASGSFWAESLLDGGPSRAANVWHHVAASYDGALLKLYINGSLTASAPNTIAWQPFGGIFLLGTGWLPYEHVGLIDEFRLYNRSLSQWEIQRDMQCSVASISPCPMVNPNCQETSPTTYDCFAMPVDDPCGPINPCWNGGTCRAALVDESSLPYICSCSSNFVGVNCSREKNGCDEHACARSETGTDLILALGFEEADGVPFALDASSYNNTGAVSSVQRVDGFFGRGLLLDDFRSGVDILDHASLRTISGAMTLMLWVKPSSFVPAILEFVNCGSWEGWWFGMEARRLAIDGIDPIELDGSTRSNSKVPSSAVDEWLHVTVTFAAGEAVRFYHNGTEVDNMQVFGPLKIPSASSDPFCRLGGEDNWPFTGIMDEVKLFNRVLAPDEIRQQMWCSVEVVQRCPSSLTEAATCQPLPNANFTCSLNAIPDPCIPNACQNGGTCIRGTLNDPRQYVCMCRPGWVGENCTVVKDDCDAHACARHEAALLGDLRLAYGFEGAEGDIIVGDSSRYGNNASIGTLNLVDAGMFGRAMRFQSSNLERISVPYDSSLALMSSYTLMCWVRPAIGYSQGTFIFKESNGEYFLQEEQFSGVWGGSSYYGHAVARGGLPTGVWTHVAVTYDGAMMRVFLNGTETGSALRRATVPVFGANNLAIGGAPTATGGYFDGLIDEVRIYSSALAPAQVRRDMACSVVQLTSCPSLVQPVDSDSGGSFILLLAAAAGILSVCGGAVWWYKKRSMAQQVNIGFKLDSDLELSLSSETQSAGNIAFLRSSTESATNSIGKLTPQFLASFSSRSTSAELHEYFMALQECPHRRIWKETLFQYMTPMTLFGSDQFDLFCEGTNVQKWILPLLLRKDLGSTAESSDAMLQSIASISMSGEQSLVQLALLLVNEVHFRQIVRGQGVKGAMSTIQHFRMSKEWSSSDSSASICRLLLFTLVTKAKAAWKVGARVDDGSANGDKNAWEGIVSLIFLVENFVMMMSAYMAASTTSASDSHPIELSVSSHGFSDAHLVREVHDFIESVMKALDSLSVVPRPAEISNLMDHLRGELAFYAALRNFMTQEMMRAKVNAVGRVSVNDRKSPATSESGDSSTTLLTLLATRKLYSPLDVQLERGTVVHRAASRKKAKIPYAGKAAAGLVTRARASLKRKRGGDRLLHVASFADRVLAERQQSASGSRADMLGDSPRSSRASSMVRSAAGTAAAAYDLGDKEVTKLQKYIKKECIVGSGAFGDVYRAKFRGDDVALKVVRMQDERSLQKFLEEVRAQSLIRSPRLLSVMAYSCQPPLLLLVTEYMAEGSLADVLKKVECGELTLSLEQRLDIAIKVAKALVYLHSGDPPLLHGDVKCHNVLIGLLSANVAAQVVRIGDFGLSRGIMAQSKESSHIRGSMLYMPPEAFGSRNAVAGQTSVEARLKQDVYSFGILLIEAFLGLDSAPWASYDAVTLISAHANREKRELAPAAACKVPAKVLAVAMKCMEPEVSSRPTMEKVLEMLEDIIM